MAEKKVAVAHKEKKAVEPAAALAESDVLQRSNIAANASKFEQESNEFDAQDKSLYIPGMNGKMRLRHASDEYSSVAEKMKFEEENEAKIFAQLKKEKDETMKKLAALAEKKKQEELKNKQEAEAKLNSKTNKEIEEMRKEWNLFCQTLDVSHHENAMKIWTILAEEGKPQEALKVNTKQIFAQAFSFPDVASNDDVIGILGDLEAAQTNYNMNPENEAIMHTFITAAQTATKDIEYKYKEFWSNPAEKVALAQAVKSAEWNR